MGKEVEKDQQPDNPRSFSVRLSDMTDDIIYGVQGIYEEVAGIEIRKGSKVSAKDLKRDIRLGCAEYRFGSSLSGHSKLFVEKDYSAKERDAYSFRFYDNQDRDADQGDQDQGEEMTFTFKNAVNAYLVERGLRIIQSE